MHPRSSVSAISRSGSRCPTTSRSGRGMASAASACRWPSSKRTVSTPGSHSWSTPSRAGHRSRQPDRSRQLLLADPAGGPAAGATGTGRGTAATRRGTRLVCHDRAERAADVGRGRRRGASAIEPGGRRPRRHDVTLAIEHTNSLRADIGFVHTLRDAIDLARRAGHRRVHGDERVLGGTRACRRRSRRDVDRIALVQVSDFEIGTRRVVASARTRRRRHPARAHPRHAPRRAGYTGGFELELLGDAIVDEGYDRGRTARRRRARRRCCSKRAPD